MRYFRPIMLAAALFLTLALQAQARAAETPANTYGFVNINRVMHDCAAGKAIRAELDGKGQQFQSELSKENQTLSAARQEFEKLRGSISQTDAEKKMRELEGKYAQADKLLQQRRHQLNKAGNASFAQLKKAAVDIILSMSKERGYAAVFSQESVILAAQEFDITDEVIKRLNDKVKKIAIDWSAKPAAPENKK